MKKLLTLIEANVLMITTVTPMIVNLNPNMTTNTKYFANEKNKYLLK